MAYKNLQNDNFPPGQNAPQQGPAAGDYGWKPSSPTPVNNPNGPPPSAFIDPEDLTAKHAAFTDESIRKGFIRKVYLILMAQLMFTMAIVALFVLHEPTQLFAKKHPELLIAAMIVTLVVVISMACCENVRRTSPTNFICLGVFTVAESFLVGCIAGSYNSDEVLIAVGITALLCFSLSMFAMQTKYDFTACGAFLLIALIALMIFGIVAIFWHNYIVKTIYGVCGALLACIFLIYDTQIMMGGTHKYSISPEEYIFAALNLYMDVIRIFIYVLQLVANKK